MFSGFQQQTSTNGHNPLELLFDTLSSTSVPIQSSISGSKGIDSLRTKLVTILKVDSQTKRNGLTLFYTSAIFVTPLDDQNVPSGKALAWSLRTCFRTVTTVWKLLRNRHGLLDTCREYPTLKPRTEVCVCTKLPQVELQSLFAQSYSSACLSFTPVVNGTNVECSTTFQSHVDMATPDNFTTGVQEVSQG
eukprot:4235255-Amphidinium_carterae.1